MTSSSRRLTEADTYFVALGDALGTVVAPVAVSVYERDFDDPGMADHLNEVMARLLPTMRQRITKDRLSTASPRWADVPGFDPADQIVVLPAPGDGTLRAVLDWAQEWGRLPLPAGRPPWRAAYFRDVTVDGVGGRLVVVSQFHHAIIDGQGAVRLAESFYEWAPEGAVPEMPAPVAPDSRTTWEHWRTGWALEGAKARELARNTGGRLRRLAADPKAGVARAKALGRTIGRLQEALGTEPMSPILERTTDRNRFDVLQVDLDALRAGARAAGGSANDGLLAAFSVGLRRWHVDHGVKPVALRTLMPINTRTADAGYEGNDLIAAVLELPLIDDAAEAVKACATVSRTARDDEDALWVLDRVRALTNRLSKKMIVRLFAPSSKAVDLSLSNVKGMPLRSWVAGVEVLDTYPFLVGGPAIGATLVSGPTHATLGVVTCPGAVSDPEHLMERIAEAIAEVAALAQP